MKIVINRNYSGWGLSRAAWLRLRELGEPLALRENDTPEKYRFGSAFEDSRRRTNPNLVKVVEALGDAAHYAGKAMKVVEIPEGVRWRVSDYDGKEHVEEVHRIWS